MNTNTLLENKIRSIVRQALREADDKKEKESKLGDDKVSGDKEYKKKYTYIQKHLDDPKVNATQVLAGALGFSPDDDAARSHAFKQLHKERTPDGKNFYQFNSDEVSKIWAFYN